MRNCKDTVCSFPEEFNLLGHHRLGIKRANKWYTMVHRGIQGYSDTHKANTCTDVFEKHHKLAPKFPII